MCGEQLDAAKALNIKLVEEVVSKGNALDAAISLAEMVANQSPSSVTACKSLIQNTRTSPLAHGLMKERELFIQLFDTQDQTEGVNAFLEKRQPQWKNG